MIINTTVKEVEFQTACECESFAVTDVTPHPLCAASGVVHCH